MFGEFFPDIFYLKYSKLCKIDLTISYEHLIGIN